MDYEEIENDIVAQLQPIADAGNFDVALIPEKEEQVKGNDGKAVFKPRITVMYKGSDFEKIETQRRILQNTSVIIQQEFVMIDILIQGKRLRGAAGIYSAVRLVKLLLVGFAPNNCQKLFITDSAFNEYDEERGVWNRSVTLYCETTVVDAVTTDEVLGILKRIQMNSELTSEQQTIEPPTAPVIEIDTVGANNIEFKWNVVEGVQGYRVDVSSTDDFAVIVVNNFDVGPATSYNATGLDSNTNYFIRARAYNHEAISVDSNVLTQQTN